ncbi:MAG: adenylate/guanylate cyclase domain-containing protein [Gallionella sp.]|nr:MAG: adenylate/guanylate cyclase domain-containing protein [Gallionella sp.]
MEERSNNKAIMCSVLFLDIVEYSKKPVAGQILLRDRFNSYLSAAIRDVPPADRIVLDTGDGAAINFLGDVEHAFRAALSLRESLLNEAPNLEPPLLVRMGINFGPVRLVRDINGQPNIVGDGINVAQRIMGFADVGQILVSHSYFNAVSRFSPQHAGMFHYQGSRTDKHVREHEVYAIIYPGDGVAGQASDQHNDAPERAGSAWNPAGQPGSGQRAMYIGAAAVAVALVGALAFKLARHDKTPVSPDVGPAQAASGVRQTPAVAPAAPAPPRIEDKSPAATSGADTKKTVERETGSKKANGRTRHPDDRAGAKAPEAGSRNAPVAAAGGGAGKSVEAYISISCEEGARVFVDGTQKGKVGTGILTLAISPGKHTVIVSHSSGNLYTQNVDLEAGKTLPIRPNICK